MGLHREYRGLLCLSLACQFAWDITQYDVTGAYLLAPPVRVQFARFPRGWREFLLARHGSFFHVNPAGIRRVKLDLAKRVLPYMTNICVLPRRARSWDVGLNAATSRYCRRAS